MNMDIEGHSKHKRWSDVSKMAGKMVPVSPLRERPTSKCLQTRHLCENARTRGEAEGHPWLKKKEKNTLAG